MDSSLTNLPAAPIHIRLLGGMEVQIDGAPMPKLRSRQGYRLLALLALRHGKTVEREHVASTLWGDSDETGAMGNLRRSLTDLRVALGSAADRLESPTRHTLRFRLDGSARLDTRELEQAAGMAKSASELDRALALYRGSLLEDYKDEWLGAERLRLEGVYCDLLLSRVALADQTGDKVLATRLTTLLRKFGDSPPPRSPTPDNAPPGRQSDGARRGSLPVYKNSFIGQIAESRFLSQVLTGSQRLVTITGMGGTGKTRLAVRVAETLREHFDGGIYFVPVGDIVSPHLLPQAVAGAIGLTTSGAGPLVERIAAFLSNSPDDDTARLLLIDNCEHLIRAPDGADDKDGISAFLTGLLDKTAANLTILATSREALRAPGERLFPLSPFAASNKAARRGTADPPAGAIPTGSAPSTGDAALPDSVQLFVERAREANPDFGYGPRNTAVIGEICDTLDGLPLAIEIAASWTPLLSVQQIADRLRDLGRRQNDLLIHRRHTSDAGDRRHNLNAMLEWSFQLLSPTHAILLSLFSVFRGGWDIDAAEAVYSAAEGIETGTLPTLHLLAELKDRSFVIVGNGDSAQVRYHFLETIRRFARGKLEQRPEFASLAAACHAAYYAELAAKAAVSLRKGDQQAEWIDRLDSDINNLRAALDWYESSADHAAAQLGLCANLHAYWEASGALAEGYERIVAALSRTVTYAPGETRARLLANAGSFAWQRGHYGAARAHYEEARTACRALDEQGLLASVLSGLANVTYYEGDHSAALVIYEESLELARQIGDIPRIALALGNLGVFAEQRGEYARAIVMFEEQLALRKAIGDPVRIAITLSNLATSLSSLRRTVEAESAFAEAESLFRASGYRTHLPYVLRMQGKMARDSGNFDDADGRLREAITLEFEGDLKNDLLASLTEYALLKSLTGAHESAARLSGTVAAARQLLGLPDLDPVRADRILERCTAALGAQETQTICFQGRLLTLTDAVATALAS